MKQAFCSLCAMVVLALACGGFSSIFAQTPSATPEPYLIQLTSSPGAFRTTANDITANGRLVVFESNGDLASDRSADRNNADGNREIFIADYAQRRIFQITNTKNVPKPAASPTPTPTPAPTPADPSQIQIEISNNRPVISLEPPLNASNQRVYTIVFSSNAPNPANFDGVDTGGALAADGNQEIWIYQVPAIADIDLTTGVNVVPIVPLSGGTFTRITDTPATLLPTPGAPPPAAGLPPIAPQVADDNRDAMISDDGNRIAFVSTGNLVPTVGNADRNPELFFFNRVMSNFTQGTNTQSTGGSRPFSVFQQNPSLSSDGTVVAFLSTANLTGNNDDGNGRGNLEIYVANYDGASISNIRQATRTKDETKLVNSLHPGRRLSRDGSLIALESLAADPKANSATNELNHAIFVYTIATDTFVKVGQRAPAGVNDVIRFPTFTDYNSLLQPATLIFASFLNYKPDGTLAPSDQASTGLNPTTVTQIYATQAVATPANTMTRLSKNPPLVANDFFVGVRPLASASRQRLSYSHGGAELGTGNSDKSIEAFYSLSPPVSSEPSATLSFFTGASDVPLPTPAVSPSPTPTPSPGSITGLAPGEIGIVRTTVEFVTSDQMSAGVSETSRNPALPAELNGVSVSVNGAAAGIYFVGSTSKQINFVVPLGTVPGVANVVINSRLNGGIQLRGVLQIVPAQPDLFSDAGRAALVNVTNPNARTGEPFTVTSVDGSGATVPTVLELTLTGVRGATTSEIKVTIGTTDITGDAIVLVRPNLEMPGFDIINFRLPASLANSPNVPVIVTVTRASAVFSSRPAATAPLTTISP